MTDRHLRRNPQVLHVYGSPMWHEDVYIVGNTEGLIALRATIDDALRRKKPHMPASESFTPADGETYRLAVVRQDADWQDKGWQSLALPYSEEPAKETRSDVVYPQAKWPVKEDEHGQH